MITSCEILSVVVLIPSSLDSGLFWYGLRDGFGLPLSDDKWANVNHACQNTYYDSKADNNDDDEDDFNSGLRGYQGSPATTTRLPGPNPLPTELPGWRYSVDVGPPRRLHSTSSHRLQRERECKMKVKVGFESYQFYVNARC